MSIPESILKVIKCCVSNPEHYVHEPVQLNCCSSNACKTCIKNFSEEFQCKCGKVNKKATYLNSITNEAAELLKQTFIIPILAEIEQKLIATESLMKGTLIKINKRKI